MKLHGKGDYGKRSKPTKINGILFPSKTEAYVYRSLLANLPQNWQIYRQVRFLYAKGGDYCGEKLRDLIYTPDFVLVDENEKKRAVFEAKGFMTPEVELRIRMWKLSMIQQNTPIPHFVVGSEKYTNTIMFLFKQLEYSFLNVLTYLKEQKQKGKKFKRNIVK